MGKLSSLEGNILVKDISEAFDFYKKVFGMKEVPYHGYNILELNGKHFYSIFQVSADEHDRFIQTMFSTSYRVLNAGIELETAEDVRRVYKLLTEEGRSISPPGPLPWSPCAADAIDKYGVGWFISMSMISPPEGCLACVPIGEKPECKLCIRWSEPGYACPKI
ncbi:MAG: VOC family protein [Defluviitaleaceae bacterium]|nr:VOC family protein [Defluviitaleaceae bacterium]